MNMTANHQNILKLIQTKIMKNKWIKNMISISKIIENTTNQIKSRSNKCTTIRKLIKLRYFTSKFFAYIF